MGIVDISEVSEDALNICNMLDGILARVVTTFNSYNVPLPTRRYWTVGQSSIDCEQLTVTLVQTYLGSPGNEISEPRRCTAPRTAVVLVTVAREIPTVSVNGRPPTSATIEEAAQISAIDTWVLLQSINLLDMWEEGGYGIGVIGTVETPPPEGGFQLVVLQLTMAIP